MDGRDVQAAIMMNHIREKHPVVAANMAKIRANGSGSEERMGRIA
jgi:hypothetical protein